MRTPEDIWRGKTDEQVAEAASCLDEYRPEGQQVILAELRRRGLPVPVQRSRGHNSDFERSDWQGSWQNVVSFLIASAVWLLIVQLLGVMGAKPSIAVATIPFIAFTYFILPSVNQFITKPLLAAFTVDGRPKTLGFVCWMTVLACLLALGHLFVSFQLSGSSLTSTPEARSVFDPQPSTSDIFVARVERAIEVWRSVFAFSGLALPRVVVYLICALGMLRGNNWARWLFVGASCFDWTYILWEGHITSAPFITVVGFAAWSAFVYYLMRHEVSQFFRDQTAHTTS